MSLYGAYRGILRYWNFKNIKYIIISKLLFFVKFNLTFTCFYGILDINSDKTKSFQNCSTVLVLFISVQNLESKN